MSGQLRLPDGTIRVYLTQEAADTCRHVPDHLHRSPWGWRHRPGHDIPMKWIRLQERRLLPLRDVGMAGQATLAMIAASFNVTETFVLP